MSSVESNIFRIELFRAAALILAVVVLLYGHTLHAPFYLDDAAALTENYRLRDLAATLSQVFSQRGLSNLTFALNFRLTGWALAPLHLTNIALHAGCGLLVWLLLRRLVAGRVVPLLGALFFIVHPLQTQAVTYLVQRSAVLGAFFFLLAFLLYLRAREVLAAGHTRSSSQYLRPYLGALLAGGCALLAKENTATLPLALLVFDAFYPLPGVRSRRQSLFDTLPFFVAPFLLASRMLPDILRSGQTTLVLATSTNNDPLHYLVTQLSVIWVYLRLLILPYGQALEHDYPLASELLTWQNSLAVCGLLLVAWSTWRIRQRRPLLAFGVAWFFLALAVESSIIPLDPLFEHRLYLPMFGLVLVLADGLPTLLGERRTWIVLGIAVLVCLPLTWRRNDLWNSSVRLNESDLKVSPKSDRVHLALIFDYRDAGRIGDAERLARQLLRNNPRSAIAYEELALLYANQGETRKALTILEDGLKLLPQSPTLFKAGANINLGVQQPQEAVAFLKRGVLAAPENAAMHNQLAALYFELGELADAEAVYRESLRLANRAATHRNLGKVLYALGRMREALAAARMAQQLEPGNPDNIEGVGMSALAMGEMPTAREALDALENIDEEGARRLRAAISTAGGR